MHWTGDLMRRLQTANHYMRLAYRMALSMIIVYIVVFLIAQWQCTFFQASKVNSINAELTEDDGEHHYKILNTIGRDNGLGVENLTCASVIAGETSRAYDDIITISLVTCRAIGIGAYLVRLGRRVIQVESSHIILTDAATLNKLLGCEVYTSKNPLGDVQIMYDIEVSRVTVRDDLEGCYM